MSTRAAITAPAAGVLHARCTGSDSTTDMRGFHLFALDAHGATTADVERVARWICSDCFLNPSRRRDRVAPRVP